jgi:hypothetical protein
MANGTRKTAVEADKALIAGIQKYLMGQPLIIGKQSYQPQDIINILLARVTTGQGIIDARTAVTAAIKADAAERTTTGVLVRGFRTIVQGMFSEQPDTLAVFGLKPRKSPKKTLVVKTKAVAASKATRKARGTLGRKQRSRIRGVVNPPATTGGNAAPEATSQPKA